MASLVHLALNETDENHPPTILGRPRHRRGIHCPQSRPELRRAAHGRLLRRTATSPRPSRETWQSRSAVSRPGPLTVSLRPRRTQPSLRGTVRSYTYACVPPPWLRRHRVLRLPVALPKSPSSRPANVTQVAESGNPGLTRFSPFRRPQRARHPDHMLESPAGGGRLDVGDTSTLGERDAHAPFCQRRATREGRMVHDHHGGNSGDDDRGGGRPAAHPLDERRPGVRRRLRRAHGGHPAEHRGDRPRGPARAPEDPGALAADRLRVRARTRGGHRSSSGGTRRTAESWSRSSSSSRGPSPTSRSRRRATGPGSVPTR